MVAKLEQYQEIAERMIKRDDKRNRANDEYDRMDHNDWKAPDSWRKIPYMRKYVSQGPSNALNTANRVLSALDEAVTLQPNADNQATKQRANDIERALMWTMKRVNRRRQGNVRKSVVRSAVKFDEVVAYVLDIDYQIKAKKIFKGDTKRLEAARRYGRFMVKVFHPNDVHVTHSDFMPEEVLIAQERRAKSVVQEWGDLAGPKLREAAEEDRYVKYFDFMDYEVHVVWIEDKMGGQEEEILREEHNLPFLPYVARIGGDEMEHEPEHRRRPILYPIRTSGSWQTQNIVQSLKVSEVISYALAPRLKEEGPIGEKSTEVDYGEPGRIADVTPQNTLQPLPPPGIDPALREMGAEIEAENTRSTVANVLQGGEVPSGTAFATLNLLTQTAIGSLKPAKELSEMALADIYTLFLLWMDFTDEPIEAYGEDKYTDVGKQYTIVPEDIDPMNIYISVELKPDVPLDRQQRANVAMMLLQRPGFYSKERALEELGETDPDAIMKQAYFEQLFDAEIQRLIQNQMMQDQIAMQQAIQQQQQMQQYAQMAAMQNQAAGAPGGNGYNPAMGGLPPAQGAPGATREGVTGEDMMGGETGLPIGGL